MKKIYIGRKMNRLELLKSFVALLFVPFFCNYVLVTSIFSYLECSSEIKWLLGFLIFSLLLLLLLPMLGTNERIEFNENNLVIFSEESTLSRLLEIKNIIIHDTDSFSIQIPYKQIQEIQLSYKKTLGGYGSQGFSIKLLFILKDDTYVVTDTNNIVANRENLFLLSQALDFLENKNIKIADKHKLRDKLILSKEEIIKYINNKGENTSEYIS